MRVCFLYNAQLHQIPHSLPIALELAARHCDIAVDVAGASAKHLDFARRLAQRYGVDAPVRYVPLHQPWDVRLRQLALGELAPRKKRTLSANVPYLSGCRALVTPERTSLDLRRRGLLPDTLIISTGHGSGDRAIAVAPEIREFDFVFNSGEKLTKRRLELGLIRPGAYATGIYAKFDWVLASSTPVSKLFDNGRPTILYSPHFDPSLSSWPAVGRRVLDYFAGSERYNLVFAPHVRLFEPARSWKYLPFRRYAGLPHMRIDLGSERSIDMSYTLAADAYLGDVSSQVAEFLIRPRPCIFLNPHRIAWKDQPNYRFWHLGPVLEDVERLGDALADAFETQGAREQAQRAYFATTFEGVGEREPSARRGADILADYLRAAVGRSQ